MDYVTSNTDPDVVPACSIEKRNNSSITIMYILCRNGVCLINNKTLQGSGEYYSYYFFYFFTFSNNNLHQNIFTFSLFISYQ
jgi:hypothetical protein